MTLLKQKNKKQKKGIIKKIIPSLSIPKERNPDSRHYCIDCKKKKKEEYMRAVGVAINHRVMWKCLNCNSENRCYGQNRFRK